MMTNPFYRKTKEFKLEIDVRVDQETEEKTVYISQSGKFGIGKKFKTMDSIGDIVNAYIKNYIKTM